MLAFWGENVEMFRVDHRAGGGDGDAKDWKFDSIEKCNAVDWNVMRLIGAE